MELIAALQFSGAQRKCSLYLVVRGWHKKLLVMVWWEQVWFGLAKGLSIIGNCRHERGSSSVASLAFNSFPSHQRDEVMQAELL